jgi:ribosomal-protein-serine acetyltransferase
LSGSSPPAGAAERVELRELRDADLEELQALTERNRPLLAEWLRWARDQTPQRTREFIRAARARETADDGLERAVVVDGHIVGMVGVPFIDWPNRRAEIGYWLDEAHQGRGLMADAVRQVLAHAFQTWKLNRVEIRTDVENRASRALAERLGFSYEGVLRQAYFVGDRYSDDAIYSLLRCEWPGRGATLDASA